MDGQKRNKLALDSDDEDIQANVAMIVENGDDDLEENMKELDAFKHNKNKARQSNWSNKMDIENNGDEDSKKRQQINKTPTSK